MADLRAVPPTPAIPMYTIELRPQDHAAACDALMYWLVDRHLPDKITVADCPLDTIWEALGEAGIVENVYHVVETE